MKPRMAVLLEECIDRGSKRGWRLAHKHVENPAEDAILDRIQNCIMAEIYEWFEFSEADYGAS
jgi:hypothetical protein